MPNKKAVELNARVVCQRTRWRIIGTAVFADRLASGEVVVRTAGREA